MRRNTLKTNRILSFSREAGGAAAIAPVCKEILRQGGKLLLLAKDHGIEIFRNCGLDCINFPKFETNKLNSLIDKRLASLPNLIFTSATSLPHLDMTERFLWKWGKKNNIPTVAVLDQWQNYALRFSGPEPNQRLAYLPDYIFAMDALAKDEMVREGIPAQRIIITGQPAFDRSAKENRACRSRFIKIRKSLRIEEDVIVVSFVAEALIKDFGAKLGYDEYSTLEFLGAWLNDFCSRDKKQKICLVIKLHPENEIGDFKGYLLKWAHLNKRLIGNNLCSTEVIAISDIIVGMTSIMLIESILSGKPTLSLQINSLVDSQLIATKSGAIPFIKSTAQASRILESLLCDNEFRNQYLARQKTWEVGKDSVLNCIENLKRILAQNLALKRSC